MDWLQFVSSVIHSLAWPAAVVLAAYFLRSQIGQVIPRIRSVKGPGFEAKLDAGRVAVRPKRSRRVLKKSHVRGARS